MFFLSIHNYNPFLAYCRRQLFIFLTNRMMLTFARWVDFDACAFFISKTIHAYSCIRLLIIGPIKEKNIFLDKNENRNDLCPKMVKALSTLTTIFKAIILEYIYIYIYIYKSDKYLYQILFLCTLFKTIFVQILTRNVNIKLRSFTYFCNFIKIRQQIFLVFTI